jgi:hypothetical protein
MTFSVKIALDEETFASFQDSFDSKNPIRDARSWVYQILTKEAKNWISIKGTGGFNEQTIDTKTGKPKTKQVKLSKFNLDDYTPQSNPDYVHKLLDPDHVQTFQLTLGNSLTEKLQKLFALRRCGAMRYNESWLHWANQRDVSEVNDKEAWEEEIKQFQDDYNEYKDLPIEEFIRAVIINKIFEKIQEHETKLMDKEFDELYPEDEDKDGKKKEPNVVKEEEKSS